MSFYPGYRLLEELFSNPALLSRPGYRETLSGFLRDPDMSPEPLGEKFEPRADPDPVPALGVGRTHVFFHSHHDFEDDTDLPLTQYQYWASVHDTERDEEVGRTAKAGGDAHEH